jgi:hypothetical protein
MSEFYDDVAVVREALHEASYANTERGLAALDRLTARVQELEYMNERLSVHAEHRIKELEAQVASCTQSCNVAVRQAEVAEAENAKLREKAEKWDQLVEMVQAYLDAARDSLRN